MGVILDYLNQRKEKESDEKKKEKFTLENWIPDAAKRAKQLSLATHICKFSHPDAQTMPIISRQSFQNDGYLHSGNVECMRDEYGIDAFGNAAAIGVFKFLLLKMQDGRTILEHLEQDSGDIREELRFFKELRLRIIEMAKKRSMSRDKNNEEYGQAWSELYNLTEIGFGGTKPQNISVLNMNNGGKAYLLSSSPPSLANREVIRPKKDFFTNSLRRNQFEQDFQYLHTLLICDRNNFAMRDKIKRTIQNIVDQAMVSTYQLRGIENGWSKKTGHEQLPMAQKIWLDNLYATVRQEQDEWLEEISRSFARWIMHTYEKILKDSRVTLGDGELLFLQKQVAEALSEEKEGLQ